MKLNRQFNINGGGDLLLVFLFLLCLPLRAQVPDFNFRQLGSEQGLNNPNIFGVQQHENGLLYVTTQNGIYTYDGYNFQRLSVEGLPSNVLETSALKGNNELYLSIRNQGLARYDLLQESFSASLSVPGNNADQVLVTASHAYLLTTQIRLNVVELQTGKVIADQLRSGKSINLPFCLLQTSNGRVLAGRSDGLYDVTGGVHRRLDVLKGAEVTALAEDAKGNIYAASRGLIYTIRENKIVHWIQPVYEKRQGTFMPGGEKTISRLLVDDFGRMWFTAFPGENLYLQVQDRTYDIFDALGIPPAYITALFKDKKENIWIGTMNEGLYQIQNTFFNSFNFRFDGKVLSINKVLLQGELLVAATNNGLYGLNVRSHQGKVLSHPDNLFLEPVSGLTEVDGALYYARRNDLNMSPSIFVDSRRTYRFKPVSARHFYLLRNSGAAMATWDGYVLVVSRDAALVYDTLVSFTDYRTTVNTMLEYDSILYIGTNNGLFTYDFRTRKSSSITSNELSFSINDLAILKGSVYAAHDGGITDVSTHKLFRQAGSFELNGVKRLVVRDEQIWLATLDGLLICDSTLTPLKLLNKSSGLLSNSVSDISFEGDYVAIATARGVSTTNLRNIVKYSSRLRPVDVLSVSAGEEIERNAGNEYHLPADADQITLQFISPLFNLSARQYFRYRLNKGEWKYFEDVTQLPFPGLPGGRHEIEICASADNITWSDATRVVLVKEEKFSEKQAVYWLISAGTIAFTGLIALVWVRRVKRRARRRLSEEQQVNLLKHQAMNALLSPHFIFNSLTSIQNYINTNNSLRASEYLAKFSRLIRMIIEKAAHSHISVYDELSRLTYYLELEKERFKNKFDYEIIIDPDLNTQEVMIPNMIIQPYVENSILHGILPTHKPGKLWVKFNLVGKGMLVITIEDNGIGLLKAAEHAKTNHKSLGTSTIRNILEVNSKLSGKIQRVSMEDKSVKSPVSTGTIITIELEL